MRESSEGQRLNSRESCPKYGLELAAPAVRNVLREEEASEGARTPTATRNMGSSQLGRTAPDKRRRPQAGLPDAARQEKRPSLPRAEIGISARAVFLLPLIAWVSTQHADT